MRYARFVSGSIICYYSTTTITNERNNDDLAMVRSAIESLLGEEHRHKLKSIQSSTQKVPWEVPAMNMKYLIVIIIEIVHHPNKI